MQTTYLSKNEVCAYLRDLLERLRRMEHKPTVWCAITRSGQHLRDLMLDLIPEVWPAQDIEEMEITTATAWVEDGSDKVHIDSNDPTPFAGKHVFVFDSAIHSGRMMSICVREILRQGAATVTSYALVIKRGSSFIPTMWGLMIHHTDRAFFLLPSIPNQRLDTGSHRRPTTAVHFYKLNHDYEALPKITTGVASLDRVEWGDRWFDVQTNPERSVYLLTSGTRTVAFLSVTIVDDECLWIDELAADKTEQGKGIGGVLMRFADNLDRHANCHTVRLYAIADKIEFYENFDYTKVHSNKPLKLGTESYQLMQRTVLYHQRPAAET